MLSTFAHKRQIVWGFRMEMIDIVAIELIRPTPSVVSVVDIYSILLFFFSYPIFCFQASEKIATHFQFKRGGINQGHSDRHRRGPEAYCACPVLPSADHPDRGCVFTQVCCLLRYSFLLPRFFPPSLPTTSLMSMVEKSLDGRQQKSAVGMKESWMKTKKKDIITWRI